jgi:hypothetical protein
MASEIGISGDDNTSPICSSVIPTEAKITDAKDKVEVLRNARKVAAQNSQKSLRAGAETKAERGGSIVAESSPAV